MCWHKVSHFTLLLHAVRTLTDAFMNLGLTIFIVTPLLRETRISPNDTVSYLRQTFPRELREQQLFLRSNQREVARFRDRDGAAAAFTFIDEERYRDTVQLVISSEDHMKAGVTLDNLEYKTGSDVSAPVRATAADGNSHPAVVESRPNTFASTLQHEPYHNRHLPLWLKNAMLLYNTARRTGPISESFVLLWMAMESIIPQRTDATSLFKGLEPKSLHKGSETPSQVSADSLERATTVLASIQLCVGALISLGFLVRELRAAFPAETDLVVAIDKIVPELSNLSLADVRLPAICCPSTNGFLRHAL